MSQVREMIGILLKGEIFKKFKQHRFDVIALKYEKPHFAIPTEYILHIISHG